MYTNSIWGDLKWQYKYGGPVVKIIMVCIAVFVFQGILRFVDFGFKTSFSDHFFDLFSDYSNLRGLLFHPWGIVTCMFLHADFFHILYNMLFLYWFGTIVQEYLGKPRVMPVFLMGGIFASLISIPLYYLFNYLQPGFIPNQGIGASAGVMSIMLAAATAAPETEINFLIVGRVRIKWIALVYVILDFLSIPGGNPGGHIAHLGGALFGWVYIRQLRNGYDLARPYYALVDFAGSLFSREKKIKVEYRRSEKEYANVGRKQESSGRNKREQTKQERLDEILDKISKSGYDSLNKEEKDFLFQISKED